MAMLELDLPWKGNEEMHRRFDRWKQECCAHEGMWLVNERIANWSGVRGFQQALRSAGEARFSTLLAQIPNLNGGLTEPDAARLCLEELEAFAATGAFGSQVWLVDAETESRLHNHIEAYEGVFIWSGRGDPVDIGVDRHGFFVRRPNGEELFRSMAFEQTQRRERAFEFRDPRASKRIVCAVGIETMTPAQNTGTPHYPRQLEVRVTTNHTDEYRYIIEGLRTVFAASASAGNPVAWF